MVMDGETLKDLPHKGKIKLCCNIENSRLYTCFHSYATCFIPDSIAPSCILSLDILMYYLVHSVALLVVKHPLISIENRQLTIAINHRAEFSERLPFHEIKFDMKMSIDHKS